MAGEIVHLIRRVNLTNAAAVVSGRSMTEALAERDVLELRHATYRALAEAATVTQSISTRSEVRFRSAISVAEVQKKADAVARALRELEGDARGFDSRIAPRKPSTLTRARRTVTSHDRVLILRLAAP